MPRSFYNKAIVIRALFRPLPFLLATLIALLFAPLAAISWHQAQHEGRVFGGVRLNGVDISGMLPDEVFALAQQQSSYYGSPALKLKVGELAFDYKPAEFGSTFDPAATTRFAMEIGRTGDWQAQLRERAEVYWRGVEIGPVVRMDTTAAQRRVAQIADQINKPSIDARLEVDMVNGLAKESPSQIGLSLDQDMSVKLIEAAIRTRSGADIILPLQTVPPKIASVSQAASDVQRLIGNDLIVMVPKWDKAGAPQQPVEAFRVPRSEMASYVAIDPGPDGTPKITFRRESFRARIEPLSTEISGTIENARFVFDDANKRLTAITPSRAGRAIDIDATLEAIEAAARSDANRTVVVTVKTVQPAVPDTADGRTAWHHAADHPGHHVL